MAEGPVNPRPPSADDGAGASRRPGLGGASRGRPSQGRPGAGTSRHNVALLVAAVVAIACTALAALHVRGDVHVPAMDEWELDTVDARFVARGPRQPAGEVVILGLDDDLRARYPDVMQKRAGWARLLTALAAAEPRIVAIDAFFASPEIVLDDAVVAQVRAAAAGLQRSERTPPAEAALAALRAVDAETRGDEALAAALRLLPPTALGVLFFFPDADLDAEDPGNQPAPVGSREPPGLAGARFEEAVLLDRPDSLRPPRAVEGVVTALPLLATATTGAGALNIDRDLDGKVRRVPLAIERGGQLYAPMGLWIAARVAGGARAPAPLGYLSGDEVVQLGERKLPVDRRAGAMIGWLGAGRRFPVVSAAALLDGSLAPTALRDKAVLVGYVDAARDRISTPFDPAMPGVELHATLADNALHGGLLRLAPGWVTVLSVALLGLLCTLLQLRALRSRRAWFGAAGAGVLLLAFVGIAQWLFVDGLVIATALPAAALLLVTAAATTAALVTEGRERAVLRQAFGQYVSTELVEQIVENPDLARLGGQRRELSILFSDIRGFSQLSEGMDPQDLSTLLNDYLTPMTSIVLQERGMLDKYIGDAVMAVYGAPLPLPDHAARACASALRMQAALDELNAGFHAAGRPELHVGIGINSGEVSVGNMGSELRFDYTVLGDAVNLSSRLESLTKEFGGAILVGEQTRALAGDEFVFRELGAVRVKGRGGAVRVYELCGSRERSSVDADTAARWQRAIDAMRASAFADAVTMLAQLQQERPDDAALAKLLERAQDLAATPPDGEWDGVYVQRSK